MHAPNREVQLIKTQRLMLMVLAAWFAFSGALHAALILYGEALEFSSPLGVSVAAQVSFLALAMMLIGFIRRQQLIDRAYGMVEE